MKKKFFLWIYSFCSFFLFLLLFPIIVLIRHFRKKRHKNKIFSLWAGTPIITLALKAKAERMLGIKAVSFVYSTYYITQEFDINLSQFCKSHILIKVLSVFAFLWACIFFDRLHFYCDRGLLEPISPFVFNSLELLVYKLLKIDVFFWTYGADVRTRKKTLSLGEPNCCTNCTLIGKACICDDKKQKKVLYRLKRYSKAIFSMGDMIEYVNNSRNDLFYWPIDLNAEGGKKYEPCYPQIDPSKPLKIIHASNHRMFKGTNFLIKVVEELKSEGSNIELILVEGIPNNEAIKIYKSADIIFDQCLIGFHGYFAIESMALGKPVMCFIRKPKKYLLHPEECPIINVHINTLKNELRRFEKERTLLREIGIKSRRYVEKYYSLEAFSARLRKIYKDMGLA